MTKLAAAARRRAVLGGLAKLGYEVRDTMSTAWAQDGRLVMTVDGAQNPPVLDQAIDELERLRARVGS